MSEVVICNLIALNSLGRYERIKCIYLLIYVIDFIVSSPILYIIFICIIPSVNFLTLYLCIKFSNYI